MVGYYAFSLCQWLIGWIVGYPCVDDIWPGWLVGWSAKMVIAVSVWLLVWSIGYPCVDELPSWLFGRMSGFPRVLPLSSCLVYPSDIQALSGLIQSLYLFIMRRKEDSAWCYLKKRVNGLGAEAKKTELAVAETAQRAHVQQLKKPKPTKRIHSIEEGFQLCYSNPPLSFQVSGKFQHREEADPCLFSAKCEDKISERISQQTRPSI